MELVRALVQSSVDLERSLGSGPGSVGTALGDVDTGRGKEGLFRDRAVRAALSVAVRGCIRGHSEVAVIPATSMRPSM
jgi:hypothetical protein